MEPESTADDLPQLPTPDASSTSPAAAFASPSGSQAIDSGARRLVYTNIPASHVTPPKRGEDMLPTCKLSPAALAAEQCFQLSATDHAGVKPLADMAPLEMREAGS